ncbi:MAG: hypothetical protein II951_04400 [Bacteroidales bacterium]|nr:hypothetical protein [Bacteroidales bacterium]
MMNKLLTVLIANAALVLVSCNEDERIEPNVGNTSWMTVNGVPAFNSYEDMVRIGEVRANANPAERRCHESFYSMQSFIEDLMDETEDVTSLPGKYPGIFEFVADSCVRPVTPTFYSCIMDTSGLFMVNGDLHMMKGHVYAVGQAATKESLTDVLAGREPKEGFDYQIVDIFQTNWNKAYSCGSQLSADYSRTHDKLDISARIYTISCSCCLTMEKQYAVEISTANYYRKHRKFKWRGHNTTTEIPVIDIKADGLKPVLIDTGAESDFEYEECRVHDSVVFAAEGVYHTHTLMIGKPIRTSQEPKAPTFKGIYIKATSRHIGDNFAIINCGDLD